MRSGVYRPDKPSAQDVPSVANSSDDAALACITRLLTSETFRRAPRLKGLLSYLWDRASTGRTAELSEQQIGTAVFGRPVDYDCANDNIVRVTVRQLRLKLQEYYEAEGTAESERVVIPKGYYVPELVPRHPESQHIEVARSRETQEPIETHAPAIVISGQPDSGLGLRFWRWVSAASIALAVCFGGLALFASHSVRRIPVSQSNWLTSNNLVKALILVPRQKTPVILGDTALQIVQEITGRVVPLDEYLNGNLGRSLPQGSIPDEIARALIASRAIAVTEVAAASRILQANPEQVQSFFIGGPNSIEPQEFRSSNVILIGNPLSNPWISLVTPQLNFQVSYDKQSRATLIRVRNPQAGEPAQFDTAGGASRNQLRIDRCRTEPQRNWRSPDHHWD